MGTIPGQPSKLSPHDFAVLRSPKESKASQVARTIFISSIAINAQNLQATVPKEITLHYLMNESSLNDDQKIKMINNMIAQGANVNEKDSDGNTLLHLAVMYRSPELVQALVAQPMIRPNLTDRFFTTPLFAALFAYASDADPRSLAIIQTLATHGADLLQPKMIGGKMLTPYDYAYSERFPEKILELLRPRI